MLLQIEGGEEVGLIINNRCQLELIIVPTGTIVSNATVLFPEQGLKREGRKQMNKQGIP